MKLGAKIIVSIMIFFSVIFLFGGYVLISYFYEVTMEREVEGAIEQYQYNKFVVQANLITRGENWFAGAADGQYDISSMASDMNGTVAFLAADGSVLFSGFPSKTEFSGLFADVEQDMVNYRFMKINNRTFLLTMGIVVHGDAGVYLITGVDVERIQEQQAQIIRKFGVVYAMAVGIGIFLIFGISFFITRPIKQLTAATKKIAGGNYGERVTEGGSDEVSQLARNFNRMAQAVDEKVQELSDSARQKEDFVANFAHELKTPLTSIIGYSDMLRSMDLPKEDIVTSASYIFKEGKRLERLAYKMMELSFAGRQEIELASVDTEELVEKIQKNAEYLLKTKEITLTTDIEKCVIKGDMDLLQSLFLNLIDNARKACSGNGRIILEGKDYGEEYKFYVKDNGCGIPESETEKITEAFYMVDKSRARKEGGAGIGLALCVKIAGLHNAGFEIKSKEGTGTQVILSFKK